VDSLVHLHSPLEAELGASGAIMGLAGMYVILFPVQKVHMAAWLRLLPIPGLRIFHITWTMRGFWLLVLWLAWHDLRPMIFNMHDQIGHWEHVGGFASGILIATLLLMTRTINAKGSDIFSVLLGKKAWALVGRPQHWHA
jgi:membrane associated rhomboid family serine protease